MWNKIRAMWNRAMRPFYVESPETNIRVNRVFPTGPNITNNYHTVLDRRAIVNGVEYEWWVHANTPWEWPEFFSLGKSPNYDIYRQVNYGEIIEGEIEEFVPPSEDLFEEIFKDGSPMVEIFADAVHKVWCSQMDWIFAQSGHMGPRGQFTINPDVVARWERQKMTPYKDLPEDEKATDRAIAKRYLRLALDG